jgi:hypothetical protein
VKPCKTKLSKCHASLAAAKVCTGQPYILQCAHLASNLQLHLCIYTCPSAISAVVIWSLCIIQQCHRGQTPYCRPTISPMRSKPMSCTRQVHRTDKFRRIMDMSRIHEATMVHSDTATSCWLPPVAYKVDQAVDFVALHAATA